MRKTETVYNYSYSGPLAALLTKHVEEKRALGYKYNTEAYLLEAFDRLSMDFGCNNSVLKKDLVLKWTNKRSYESVKSQKNRIVIVRQFAAYMTRCGYEAYTPRQGVARKSSNKYVPYIFSNRELAKIFTNLDSIAPSHWCPQRVLIYPLIFRMLYGSGLRLSEALNLKVVDVDLEQGVLRICHAKFDKDRLIPMTESLVARCREYSKIMHRDMMPGSYFFPAPDGGVFTQPSLYKVFRIALSQSGIPHGGKGCGPRIHDFRHTFSVHCLRKWVLEGKDITSALPALSAYLGHESLEGTQDYLRLTAELYPNILTAVRDTFGDIIPKVGDFSETD